MGVTRAADIVKSLKVFSRADTRSVEPVDLAEVIHSTLRMAANVVRHRARLVLDICEQTPRVLGNNSQLGQLALNLIVNAAHSMDVGSAEDDVLRIALRPSPEGNRVVLEVSDTGTGMPPEVLGRVFDPFFTTKPVGSGTGLGLSICHSIVTGLGGEITASSREGEGTTFRVVLDAAPVVPAAAASSEPSADPARAHVLVIDDEPMIARAVARILRSCRITACTQATEALVQLIHAPAPDVVLCDLMMPDLTGMELFARIQREAPGLSSRFVFMTGGVFSPEAADFIERCENVVLDKPIDAAKLRAVVGAGSLRQLT
jgi:CheY-like chemotaxis protein/two-component sensor histidine kinase